MAKEPTLRLLSPGGFDTRFGSVVANTLPDGGRVRSLSSLLILHRLMRSINPETPPKPCEVFDLIGGTGAGGYDMPFPES
jgi:hypothetical protein